MNTVAVHIVYNAVDDIFSAHMADACPRSRRRCIILKTDRIQAHSMMEAQKNYDVFQDVCRGVYTKRYLS